MASNKRKQLPNDLPSYELILQKLDEIHNNSVEVSKLKKVETSKLKNDVQKLQDIVLQQGQLITKMDENSSEASQNHSLEIYNLNKEMRKLQENSFNQTQIIVELLSEIKSIVKANLCPGLQNYKYQDLFPILTQAQIEAVEQEINEDTKEAMISTIKYVLGKGELQKNLKDLIDISLLMEYNVYGLQRKKRLLNYPKFMKAIYRAVGSEFGNKNDFYKHLGKCIRLTKNLHYKKESLKRSASTDSD